MQPDQRPQKPPREPVHDRYPDIPTDSPKYPRTPDPYPMPGKDKPRA